MANGKTKLHGSETKANFRGGKRGGVIARKAMGERLLAGPRVGRGVIGFLLFVMVGGALFPIFQRVLFPGSE